MQTCFVPHERPPLAAGMLLPPLDYAAPSTIDQALALLGAAPGEVLALAGGTDLLVQLKRGLRRPRLLVSLRHLGELHELQRLPDGGLHLGALTTMSRLAADSALASFSALAEGAGVVGGPAIRNRATVGGNVVNARPCADTAAPLVALGARLQLVGPDGRRELPLDEFITGPGQTTLRPAEILVAITLPPADAAVARGSAYAKLTRRAALEVTIVGCAARLDVDRARGVVTCARLVLTSVAATPLTVREAELALVGRPLDEESLRAAAAAVHAAVTPIDDHRAPAAYRREVSAVLARRTLRQAWERAAAERGT